MRTTRRPFRLTRRLAPVLFGGLSLIACSSGGDESRGASGDSASLASNSGAGEAAVAEPAASGDSTADALATSAEGAQRQRIYTGEIALRAESSDDVPTLADRVAKIVTEAGGSVSSDQRTRGSDATAQLTVRVPPEQVDSTIREIEKLGDVANRSVSLEDVTAQYTDLEGRIAALEISADRLRGFLGTAADAGQLALIEGELARREADLESMKGQLRVLTDQVDMARIDVSISTRPPAIGESDDGPMGFGTAVATGWRVVGLAARWSLAAAGVLVPFAPVIALLMLPVFVIRRRNRSVSTS